MKVTLVCSCGLLLEQDDSAILVDAPNCDFPPFEHFPDAAMADALQGRDAYSNLKGIYFTHMHPDHCDPQAANQIRRAREGVTCFIPDETMPKHFVLKSGAFRIECCRIPHTPVTGYPEPPHYTFWISAGGKSVYVAADAAPDTEIHEEYRRGRVADAAFWNGQYLSHPETRSLLVRCAVQNFVYHIPMDEADLSGIRRKCNSNMSRFSAELQSVRLLTQYPFQIDL